MKLPISRAQAHLTIGEDGKDEMQAERSAWPPPPSTLLISGQLGLCLHRTTLPPGQGTLGLFPWSSITDPKPTDVRASYTLKKVRPSGMQESSPSAGMQVASLENATRRISFRAFISMQQASSMKSSELHRICTRASLRLVPWEVKVRREMKYVFTR